MLYYQNLDLKKKIHFKRLNFDIFGTLREDFFLSFGQFFPNFGSFSLKFFSKISGIRDTFEREIFA